MKNKLTSEEKLLNNKIGENDFAFEEASWVEMEQMLGKKTFFAKYGTIAKAIIGLVVVSAAVYLLNEKPQKNIQAAKVEVTNTEEKAAIESSEALETEAIKVDASESFEIEAAVHYNSTTPIKTAPQSKSEKSKQLFENLEEDLNLETENTVEKSISEAVQEVQQDIKHEFLNELIINGKTCLNQEVVIYADLNHIPEELRWFYNNSLMSETTSTLPINLESIGKQSIKLQAIVNNEIVDEKTIEFIINETMAIDFTYKEGKGAFDDLKVIFESNQNLDNQTWTVSNGVELNGPVSEYQFTKKGIYDVTLTLDQESGCTSSITKPVAVLEDFVPLVNAFSPNGDGVNDEFLPKVFTIVDAKFQMAVYNLAGQMVYSTNSIHEPWNGLMNNTGEKLTTGNYIWKVRIENIKGEVRNFTNKVKLID